MTSKVFLLDFFLLLSGWLLDLGSNLDRIWITWRLPVLLIHIDKKPEMHMNPSINLLEIESEIPSF